MITDAEFLIVRAFDNTLVRNVDHAQALINAKNSELVKAGQIIQRLRAELAAEQAKNANLIKQITYAATQ